MKLKKTKRRKGLSIPEVLMSITLIGVLGIALLNISMYAFQSSLTLKKQTQLRTEAGTNLEETKLYYKKLLDEKVRLEENKTLTSDQKARLAEINLEIAKLKKTTLTLFGSSVDIYSETMNTEIPNGGQIGINYGLVETKKIIKKVPVIKNVEISGISEIDSTNGELYFGNYLKCAVSIEEDTKLYLSRTMYRWYASKKNFITTDFTTSVNYEDGDLLSPVFTNYTMFDGTIASDFEEIKLSDTSTATMETLNVTNFKGRFVLCLATPLSVNGEWGNSMISGIKYVSALPTDNSTNYHLVVEPSLLKIPYDSKEYVDNITRINSSIKESTYYNSIVATSNYSIKNPKVYIKGNECRISSAVSGRIIKLENSELKLSLAYRFTGKLYAVVKGEINGNYVKLSNTRSGEIIYKDINTGYCVVKTTNINWKNDDVVANADDLKIAEMLFVDTNNDTQIENYLRDKYGIRETND